MEFLLKEYNTIVCFTMKYVYKSVFDYHMRLSFNIVIIYPDG